jgi:hypothetical protein
LLTLQLEKLSKLPAAGVIRRAERANLPQKREGYDATPVPGRHSFTRRMSFIASRPSMALVFRKPPIKAPPTSRTAPTDTW